MFKIGEFSKLTQVSIRMLRYYDQVGLLKPAEIDPWTSYRFYTIHQIPVLEKIIYLRDSGFHVAEISAALAEKDDLSLVGRLNAKKEEIEANIRLEQEKLKKLEIAKNGILTGQTQLHYHISMKSIPRYQVLSLRKNIPAYDCEGELWEALAEFVKKNHIQTGSTFSICHDAEYKETDVDVEVCAMVQKPGENIDGFTYRETEPISVVAATMVPGEFSNIAGAYKAFARWLQLNSDYKMANETRQIVHRGPWNEKNPQNYLIELQIPLKKRDET